MALVSREDTVERARLSRGASSHPIYSSVARLLAARHTARGVLLDVGCGCGLLWPHVSHLFDRYVGIDAVRYLSLSDAAEFVAADLDEGPLPLPDGAADVTAAVETIEHLENPRAFFRELTRLTRQGGWIVVTTPNQRSLLSLGTLLWRGRHGAFQDIDYPAHLTALLEVDLLRIAGESDLAECAIAFTLHGRFPRTRWHYPRWLSALFPRALSDNLLLAAKKPATTAASLR